MQLNQRQREAQKSSIKAALSTAIRANQVWHVISVLWFEKWKRYVDFDNDQADDRVDDAVAEAHPGEIDNRVLQGAFPEDLSKNISEGTDYILLPSFDGNTLYTTFGGGPKYIRNTISTGTGWPLVYQVKLWPIRLHFWVCTNDAPNPVGDYVCNAYTTVKTVKNLEYDIPKWLGFGNIYNYRLWVKSPEDNVEIDDRPPGSDVPRRFLTRDKLNRDGDWKFCKNWDSNNLSDLLGTKDCLEFIVEKLGGNDWPRQHLMNKWMTELRPGDELDVLRQQGKTWEHAVVKSVDADTKDVTLHFKGLLSEHDEVLPCASISEKHLLALYSKTTNWRCTLDDDDLVEYNICAADDVAAELKRFIWIQARILEVDEPNQKIQITYKQSIATAAYIPPESKEESTDESKEESKEASSPSTATTTATTSDGVMSEGTSMEATSMDTNNEMESPDLDVEVWVDLHSEDLCKAGTHIPIMIPHKKKQSGMYRYYDDDGFGEKNVSGTPPVAGAVGLANLGNTCFMNSIIQCLSHTEPLTEIFLSNRYRRQINYDNVLGHGGKIAQVYAKLIKDIWSDRYTKVVPRLFKTTIGEFQPQFSGYEQQDSQELMGFVLDGLHEDMNRIQSKPFVQKIESKGRDDELISREAWRRFLLRNDSEIVDKVYGQLKSHVTCLNCNNVSVTFEPFSSLSLPVPVKMTRTLALVVYLLPAGRPPIKIDVEYMRVGERVKDIKQRVVEQLIAADKFQPISAQCKAEGVVVVEDDDDGKKNSNEKAAQETDVTEEKGEVQPSGSAECAMECDEEKPGTNIGESKAEAKNNESPSPMPSFGGYYFHLCLQFYEYKLNQIIGDNEEAPPPNRNRDTFPPVMIQLPSPVHQKPFSVPFGKDGEPSPHHNYYSDIHYMYLDAYKELKGFAESTRLVLNKTMTNNDVHKVVGDLAKRFIAEGDSERPYDLIVCNQWLRKITKEVPEDDEPFIMPMLDTLVVRWKVVREKTVRRFDTLYSERDIAAQKATEEERLNLASCLSKYVQEEQLASAETIYCSNCKQHLAPKKKLDIWACPDILILHLKRFLFHPGQYSVIQEKITELIDFPVEGLDLTSFVKGPIDPAAPPIYDLYAVSQHSGSMRGGHYTANCKNFRDQKWYDLNDSYVSTCNALDSVKSNAYVLFYKRRTGSCRWAGIVPLPPNEAMPDEE